MKFRILTTIVIGTALMLMLHCSNATTGWSQDTTREAVEDAGARDAVQQAMPKAEILGQEDSDTQKEPEPQAQESEQQPPQPPQEAEQKSEEPNQ